MSLLVVIDLFVPIYWLPYMSLLRRRWPYLEEDSVCRRNALEHVTGDVLHGGVSGSTGDDIREIQHAALHVRERPRNGLCGASEPAGDVLLWLARSFQQNELAGQPGRHIKPLEESYCPACDGVIVTSDHIFASCPKARRIWRCLHTTVSEGLQQQPWCIGLDLDLPAKVRLDVMLISLWHIWKARNAMIFNNEDVSPNVVLHGIINDLDCWACRYKRDRGLIGAWKAYIQECLNPIVLCSTLPPPCIFSPRKARAICCNFEPVLMAPSFNKVECRSPELIEKKNSDREK
jgi:hypothetical protein